MTKVMDLFEDRIKKSYFFHKSDLYGEYIAKGYCVFFTPNHNSKGDRAENITVVVADEEE